jgi:aspartate/methionine/tyrosine aminotransferase
MARRKNATAHLAQGLTNSKGSMKNTKNAVKIWKKARGVWTLHAGSEGWLAKALGGGSGKLPAFPGYTGFGATEDEAMMDLARLLQWPLWDCGVLNWQRDLAAAKLADQRAREELEDLKELRAEHYAKDSAEVNEARKRLAEAIERKNKVRFSRPKESRVAKCLKK